MNRYAHLPTAGNDATAVLRPPGSRASLAGDEFDLGPDPLPARPALEIPGYEVVRELGRGGMGVVYLAKHLRLGRLVALKTVLDHRLAGNEDRARFRQECESVAGVNHPNVCQVYEVGEAAGTLYAAFEYVPGGTLAHRLTNGPLPASDAARLVATLARAVQFAHDQGIVHRDLKPGNILIGNAESGPGRAKAESTKSDPAAGSATRNLRNDLQPKVTDFGLAKRLDAVSHLTRTGTACGTPNYMAPEQVRGQRGGVGVAADVYGLGGIFYECLSGRPPFVGDNPLAVMQAVLALEPVSLQKLTPGLPRDLNVIALTCLEKDPARRYASAGALADDLERFLRGDPILARPVGPVERAWRWIKRSPFAAALIALLAVGFVVVSGFAWELSDSLGRERAARADAAAKNRALEMAVSQAQVAEERSAADAAEARRQALRAVAATEKADWNARISAIARERADANAAKAASAAKRSEEAFAVGLAAVDRILVRVASDPKFADSDFVAFRDALLKDTVSLYERLSREQGGERVELAKALAQYRLGRLFARSGDTERASSMVFEAWRSCFDLARREKATAEAQIVFAETSLGWLELHAEIDELSRISRDAVLDEARTAVGKAVAVSPGDPRTDDILIRCHIVEAAVAKTDGDLPRRRAALRAAEVAVSEAIRRAGPTDESAKRLRDLRLGQASVAADANDPAADRLFRGAVSDLESQIDSANPTGRGAGPVAELAALRRTYAEYLLTQNRPADARGVAARAADAMRDLERRVPDFRPYRTLIGEVLATAAKAVAADGGHADGLFSEAEKQLDQVWRDGSPNYRASAAMLETQLHFAKKAMAAKEWVPAGDRYTKAAAARPTGSSPNDVLTVNAAICYARGKDELKLRAASDRLYRHEIPQLGAFLHLSRAWLIAGDVSEAAAAVKYAAGQGYFSIPGTRTKYEADPAYSPVRDRLSDRDYAESSKK